MNDALPANDCVNAMEESEIARLRIAGDPTVKYLARMSIHCLQHQACLSKKPGLLMIPGLCSGLVRMCVLSDLA